MYEYELAYWKGRRLETTISFRKELYDTYKKNLDLVHDILDRGIHKPESKDKTIVTKPTKRGFWELVYSEKEDSIVLIHLKLRGKRK